MKALAKQLYSHLPPGLARRIADRAGEHLRIIDFSVLEIIRQAPLETLKDRVAFESLLPRLGLCGGLMLYPDSLQPFRDTGLEHMQMPNQFAPYAVQLGRLGIRRYCEIGVKYGGTLVITAEYLQRLGTFESACSMDINFCPSLVKYSRLNPRTQFHQMDSHSPEAVALMEQSRFDAVFVDGDHEEGACYEDILNAVRHARHVVVHDISNDYTPGPGNAWRRFQKEFAGQFVFHEFTEQYPEASEKWKHRLLGIGLAERKSVPGGAS